MKLVNVVAAVILSEGLDKVFIAKRASNAHQGGLWEFPGGKLEENETAVAALTRELKEEIGIDALTFLPLIKLEHQYPDKLVELDVYCVTTFLGEPHGAEGQETTWVEVKNLRQFEFPAANEPIIFELLKRY